MIVSLTILGWIVGTIVVWFLLCLIIALVMFGDDEAFVIGPIVASLLLLGFWLIKMGVITLVP